MGDAQSTRTTLAEREALLRRVAVVLSSLPAPTASRILASIDATSRSLVHQTVATLPNIGKAERRSAIESFKKRFAEQGTPLGFTTDPVSGIQDEFVSGDDTLKVSSASTSKEPTPLSKFRRPLDATATISNEEKPAEPSTQDAPFSFLDDAEQCDVAKLLSDEHPQVIALVMASIRPDQAAGILPLLDTELQSQTLTRIGRLDLVDEEALADVACQLRRRYLEYRSDNTTVGGKRALDAIIAEMPELAATIEKRSEAESASITEVDNTPKTEPPILKIAEGTSSFDSLEDLPDDGTSVGVLYPEPQIASDTSATVDSSVANVNDYLVSLAPSELVYALGQVSTRDALLTLCGLPNRTAENAIALLSRKKARQVRSGIASLGALQLRDIDAAKLAVSQVPLNPLQTNQMVSQAA